MASRGEKILKLLESCKRESGNPGTPNNPTSVTTYFQGKLNKVNN